MVCDRVSTEKPGLILFRLLFGATTAYSAMFVFRAHRTSTQPAKEVEIDELESRPPQSGYPPAPYPQAGFPQAGNV
jgi:hypothetical protein